MHVPRDPGEWLLMAALMAAVMAIGMIAMHGVRSHLAGTGTGDATAGGGRRSHGGPMQHGMTMSVGTWVVQRLLGLGIPIVILGPMMLLTVRGRTTGLLRTVPLDVHEVKGRRYLIASHGVGMWVQNLRAAGEGTLRLGRRRIAFAPRELAPEEAGPIIRAALGGLIGSNGWRGRGLRNNLGLGPAPSDADYALAAREHPVFEIEPKV